MKVTVGKHIIGNLVRDKLVKRGKQAVLFRLYDGFGVAQSVFDEFAGINSVEIHYQDKVYTASREAFLEHGLLHTQPGYETQLVLPRRFFGVQDAQQISLFVDGISGERSNA